MPDAEQNSIQICSSFRSSFQHHACVHRNECVIHTLAKEKYSPYTNEEIFKEIFEQAENFKKNNMIVNSKRYMLPEDTGYAMAAEPQIKE